MSGLDIHFVEARFSSISEASHQWIDSRLSFEAVAYDELDKVCFSFKTHSL